MADLERFQEAIVNSGVSVDSDIYNALSDAFIALSFWNLDSGSVDRALNLISEYGLSDLESTPNIPADAWVEFDYGNVKIGEYVMVANDAYDSSTGRRHNGRLGVLTGMSGRRCTVRYIAEQDHAEMRHPMDKLRSISYVVKSKFND